MKKFFLVLAACLALVGSSGCVAEYDYGYPPAVYTTGAVEFCDDWGCRMINAPYYYYEGEVVYWDAHFGCWIGPRGYLVGGVWRRGYVPGYHVEYHAGVYHRFTEHTAGWKAGSGYHGYGRPHAAPVGRGHR